MRLDEFLARSKQARSRTHAKDLIERGLVRVSGAVVTKPAKEVTLDAVVLVADHDNYVGRGGRKLETALITVFGSQASACSMFSGKHVLDVGSSTGGFTQCALRFGAAHVTAVDVGTSQFSQQLLAVHDTEITLHEGVDIRNFPVSPYDAVVADLSFISLVSILPTVVSFMGEKSFCFLLIKPQFEVGSGNTKKGIVKDDTLVEEVVVRIKKLAGMLGLLDIQVFPCAVMGGDGNQEYFLYGRKD